MPTRKPSKRKPAKSPRQRVTQSTLARSIIGAVLEMLHAASIDKSRETMHARMEQHEQLAETNRIIASWCKRKLKPKNKRRDNAR